jgi:hypothetical protein
VLMSEHISRTETRCEFMDTTRITQEN